MKKCTVHNFGVNHCIKCGASRPNTNKSKFVKKINYKNPDEAARLLREMEENLEELK